MPRQICGLNTRLKMTYYLIVARERDELPTQTLEECVLAEKAWSRMSAKVNNWGWTDGRRLKDLCHFCWPIIKKCHAPIGSWLTMRRT